MAKTHKKTLRRNKIKLRVRKTLSDGTADRPRLTVFRSNKEIYAQLIDDAKGVTLASASTRNKDFSATGTKTEQAMEIGKKIAVKAKDLGIEKVVFDRNGYLYHGRVKALADGAREGGLKL